MLHTQAEDWEMKAHQAEGESSSIRLELLSVDTDRRHLRERVDLLEKEIQGVTITCAGPAGACRWLLVSCTHCSGGLQGRDSLCMKCGHSLWNSLDFLLPSQKEVLPLVDVFCLVISAVMLLSLKAGVGCFKAFASS